MRVKFARYAVLILSLLLLVATTTRAADVISFEITHAYSFPGFQLNWTLANPVVDDIDGNDFLWIALVDCQGAVIGYHVDSYNIADGPMRAMGATIPLASLAPITGSQVVAELYDTTVDHLLFNSIDEIYGLLQNYPLVATNTIDMGDTYPECPPPEEPTPNPELPPVFEDDRLNNDAGAPIVIYNVDGSFQIYKIGDDSAGTIAVYISAAELAALETPAENTEIARSADGSIVVYKLSSGEIQVNTAPDSEGKVFVYVLSADALTLISSDSYIA